MYDPSVGQFIEEDPIGFDGGDTNLYRYCGNSPTNYTDPSGLAATPMSPISLPQAEQLLDRRYSKRYVPSPEAQWMIMHGKEGPLTREQRARAFQFDYNKRVDAVNNDIRWSAKRGVGVGEVSNQSGSGEGENVPVHAPNRWVVHYRPDWGWLGINSGHGFLLVKDPAGRYWELHHDISGASVKPGGPPSFYLIAEARSVLPATNTQLVTLWYNGGPGPYEPIVWDCNAVSFYYLEYPNSRWWNTLYAP